MVTNPAIVIPTIWTRESSRRGASDRTVLSQRFRHGTDIGYPNPRLAATLESLSRQRDVGKVILVVGATDRLIEQRADERVREVVAGFPTLDILVVGPGEFGSLTRRLEQIDLAGMIPALTPESYGSVRNLGLIAAAVLGHDAVIFIDDDELCQGGPTCGPDDFMERATFGLGARTYMGTYVLAKTGYAVDASGSWRHTEASHWSDTFWNVGEAYNEAMAEVLVPPRLQPAKFAIGGALAIHREMFTKVAFDPWITRGEDADYVLNMRLHGAEMYFDDQWTVTDLPPERSSDALRFRHEVSAFVYSRRKMEFSKSQVDLRPVNPHDLAPFPGDFLDSTLTSRAFLTGALRALAGRERSEHMSAAAHAVREAGAYARKHCANYFALQRAWGYMMDALWEDVPLKSLYSGERSMDHTHSTGSFRAV